MFADKKQVVFFGSGVVAEKSLSQKPVFIVDNNPDLQGTKFHGIDVKSPNTLLGHVTKYQVVVCTTSISEVRKQLASMGYEWGKDANVSSYLAERLEIADLEDEMFQFVISSGLPSTSSSEDGGGIYQITETRDSYPEITKLYAGNTHGMIKSDSGYAFTSQGDGIVLMSPHFEVTNIIPLPSHLRPHGLRQYKDKWVVVSSYEDCIIGLDNRGLELFRYEFSDKRKHYGSAQHHCNDICIVGDYAYVSMFSVTGNWKRGSFDGGIIEVDLASGRMKTIQNDLTMPHSIEFKHNSLSILNSFKGQILQNNFEVFGVLPGFVRGYDENETYMFVGESKNRNFSRLETGRTPVTVDSKITIINKKRRFARSVPLPMKISEIHSLMLIK